MRYSLITQSALILISFVIIFTFIKPMFAEIKTIQDELFAYKDAVSKASLFNAKLQELIATRKSFAQDDVETLESFIPTTIDSLKIVKDIESIFAIQGVLITSLSATDEVVPVVDIVFESDLAVPLPTNEVTYKDFEVRFTGQYEDLKQILLLAEANKSLLEVVDLKFSAKPPEEGVGVDAAVEAPEGEFIFTLVFRAYRLQPSV